MSIIIKGKPMSEYIKEQMEKGEVLENVYGVREEGHTRSVYHGSQIIGGGNMVLTNNARVTISRGGKKYTIKGNRIEKRNGQWYVDGKAVDWDNIGGRYEEEFTTVEIHGNVEQLHTQSGDVKVIGDVQNLCTTSGDVECQSAYNVHTTSGDVTCNQIGGSVSTISGDINRK